MSILEDAVKHFSSKGERTIEVKEWNAVFTVKPLNLDEQRRLFDKTQKNPIEAIVDLIIMKCLKENGDKAFSLNDRQKLMTEVDPNILAELSSKITGETTIESEKKT